MLEVEKLKARGKALYEYTSQRTGGIASKIVRRILLEYTTSVSPR